MLRRPVETARNVRVEAVHAEDEAVTVVCAGSVATAIVAGGAARLELDLGDADLWWPAGHGAQTRHDLTVPLAGTSETRRIDLRSVEHVVLGGALGFRVNGRDVFCRGANWSPADALAGRGTREGAGDLLESAVAANMNMIRVWGGGRSKADWFYVICDELGFLVWHDFMLACHLYPSTSEFLAEVAAEMRENVCRLNHQPSIALWCGNGLVDTLNWFEESRAVRDRYLVSCDRLNRTVETALRDVLLEANQRNAGGEARIAETMFRYFRFPSDFGGFVYLSQVQQGLAIQTAVDHWRGLKPRCMGTLYWQLASWSSLGYGGGWKLLHHRAKRFYAPLRVMVVPRDGGFNLRAVNDHAAIASLSVDVFAVGMDGETRRLVTTMAEVRPAAALDLTRVRADAVGPREILLYRWSRGEREEGEEHFAPLSYKAYDLHPRPTSRSLRAVGSLRFLLRRGHSSLHWRPRRCGCMTPVSRIPGRPRRMHLATNATDAPTFAMCNLHGATYN